MKRVIGPSVLLLAGAIGSGEYVLWPYITAQVGLALVWLTVLGVLTQYFLNMEIERYTLATGETAVTGFTRLWKPWGVLFIVMAVGAWMWPGWATGGTTTLSFALGFSEDLIPYITIGVLVLIGVGADRLAGRLPHGGEDPVLHGRADRAVRDLRDPSSCSAATGYAALGRGFVEVDKIPDAVSEHPDRGAARRDRVRRRGGVMNLVQSNWVRDKGLGMGARMPRVVSPFTGEEVAAPTTGYFFHRDEENMRRWNGWWKVADREQFVTFFVIGAIALLTFMTLTFVTVGTGGEESFDFIQVQGEALKAPRRRLAGHRVLADRQRRAVLDQPDRARHGRPADRRRAQDRRTARQRPLEREPALLRHRVADDPVGSVILLSGVDPAAGAAGDRRRRSTAW